MWIKDKYLSAYVLTTRLVGAEITRPVTTMVSNINVSVDDDVHERLYDEKERRGLSWREFLEELSHEVPVHVENNRGQ